MWWKVPYHGFVVDRGAASKKSEYDTNSILSFALVDANSPEEAAKKAERLLDKEIVLKKGVLGQPRPVRWVMDTKSNIGYRLTEENGF